MGIAITIVHLMACLFLVVVVLLQQGKGADIGAVFGGSSSTVFGSSGAGSFLSKLTTGVAALFMLTSLGLTYLSSAHLSSSVFDTSLPEPPPLQVPAEAVPEGVAVPPAAPAGGEESAGAPGEPAAPAAAEAEGPAAAAEPAPVPAEPVQPAAPPAGGESGGPSAAVVGNEGAGAVAQAQKVAPPAAPAPEQPGAN